MSVDDISSIGEAAPQNGPASVIRRDFESREFVQIVQMNIMKMVEFINHFDHSMRFKLSSLNEKLFQLEKSLEYCESISVRAHDSDTYEDTHSVSSVNGGGTTSGGRNSGSRASGRSTLASEDDSLPPPVEDEDGDIGFE